MPTCVHRASGLCPECQADHDADPAAWAEFGRHPAGIARWRALEEEMARAAADEPGAPAIDPEIPF